MDAMVGRREFVLSMAAGARPAPAVLPGSVLVHEHVIVDFAGVKSAASGSSQAGQGPDRAVRSWRRGHGVSI